MSSLFWFNCSGSGDGIRVTNGLLGGGNLCTSGIELPFHIVLSISGVETRRLKTKTYANLMSIQNKML